MYHVLFVLSSVHNYTSAAELLEQRREEITMVSVPWQSCQVEHVKFPES